MVGARGVETDEDDVGTARVAGRLVSGSGAQQPFADIFGRARGEVQPSGLAVSVGRGVDAELSQEQLDRMSLAADRAEAQGAGTAVVMMDGVAYELDVTGRTITGVVSGEGGIRAEIDTFLFAPEPAAPSVGVPSAGVRNAELAQILADRDGA